MSQVEHVRFPWALLRFWTWRILPAWLGIAAIVFLMQIAVAGIVHDNEKVKGLLMFLDMLPSFVKTALGGDALQAGNIPALLAIGRQHPLVLTLYMLFAVGVPSGLLTGEVQTGAMELILSRPATRLQVFMCAAAVSLVGMAMLHVVTHLGMITATSIYEFSDPVPLDFFFRLSVNGGLLAAAVVGISLFCAVLFRRRGAAVGAAASFLIVNYFISIVAEWWPRMAPLQYATIFYLVNGRKLWYGWPVRDLLIITAILVVSLLAAGWIWRRRDLHL